MIEKLPQSHEVVVKEQDLTSISLCAPEITLPTGFRLGKEILPGDINLGRRSDGHPALLLRGAGRSLDDVIKAKGFHPAGDFVGDLEMLMHSHTSPYTNGDSELVSLTTGAAISIHYAACKASYTDPVDDKLGAGFVYLIDTRQIAMLPVLNSEQEFVSSGVPLAAIVGCWRVEKRFVEQVTVYDESGEESTKLLSAVLPGDYISGRPVESVQISVVPSFIFNPSYVDSSPPGSPGGNNL